MERNIKEAVRRIYPNETWTDKVSKSRLKKAEWLIGERRRRGQECELFDCLQTSDKIQILLKDARFREALGIPSSRRADALSKAIESLRNNLAHGQDFVVHDWDIVTRITGDLDSLLEARGVSRILNSLEQGAGADSD